MVIKTVANCLPYVAYVLDYDIMSPKSTKERFINFIDCRKQTRTLEDYVQGNWTLFGVVKTFHLSLGFLSSKKKMHKLGGGPKVSSHPISKGVLLCR